MVQTSSPSAVTSCWGGPQAGILVGRVQWLEPLKRHPLTRALRVDKLTLAALEATLEAYRDPRRAADEIPALRMLTVPPDTLRRRAEALAELLAGLPAEIVETEEPAGGGSLPDTALPALPWRLLLPPVPLRSWRGVCGQQSALLLSMSSGSAVCSTCGPYGMKILPILPEPSGGYFYETRGSLVLPDMWTTGKRS